MRRAPLYLIIVGLVAVTQTALPSRQSAPPSVSRLQPDLICLDPSAEFPVACDEDDD